MSKSYSEKLKDPRWQKKRLEVMQRDGFRCLCCGDKEKTLHVHHRWYEKGAEPWAYPDEVYQTLCEECHKMAGDMAKTITQMSSTSVADMVGTVDFLEALTDPHHPLYWAASSFSEVLKHFKILRSGHDDDFECGCRVTIDEAELAFGVIYQAVSDLKNEQ